MTDPIATTTAPTFTFPFEEVLKPLENRSFITLGADATPLQRTWAAFSGDKNRLDLGDVFHALTNPSLYSGIPEARAKLLEILGYRGDGSSRLLSFKAIALGPNRQLALTIITPEGINPAVPPVIFAAGFAHPASLYTSHLVALAKAMQTRVVIFDAPGIGGSQSSTTVDAAVFYTALKAAITGEVPDGKSFIVIGHSLGCSAAYQLLKDLQSGKTPVGRRELRRVVIVNPIPSLLHEISGVGRLSRSFLLGGLGSQIGHGLAGMQTNSLSLSDNDAPDKISGRKIVAREDVPISVPGMISILGGIDLIDPARHVGQDGRLAVVISRDDRLMNWDADTFEGQRGYTVIPGDHGACLTGTAVTGDCTKALVRAVTEDPDSRRPALDVSEIYRGATGRLRLGIQGGSSGKGGKGSLAFVPEILLKVGALSLGQDVGMYLNTGFLAELGYLFGASARWKVMPQVQFTTGIEGLRWPLFIETGIRSGLDYLKPGEPQIASSLIATIGMNLARIIDITVTASTDIDGTFQGIIGGLALRLR